jgi:hypothetical protein
VEKCLKWASLKYVMILCSAVTDIHFVKFEISTEMTVKIQVIWVVMLNSRINDSEYSGGTSYLLPVGNQSTMQTDIQMTRQILQ